MQNVLLFSSGTILKKPVKVAPAAADSTAACSGPESKSWNFGTRKWEDFTPLR